ncbi:unnamed protein product, partial [marine sediment metagenome]
YYDILFDIYDGGGIQSRIMIGLGDYLFLGLSFDVEKAIGNQTPKVYYPHPLGKMKLVLGDMGLAIGYDSFFVGPDGKEVTVTTNGTTIATDKDIIYGPYLVGSKPIYLMGSEQHFHLGLRIPVVPSYDEDEISLFFGLDIPLNPEFVLLGEIEKIYFNSDRFDEILYNFGLKFTMAERLGVKLGFRAKVEEETSRTVTIEYQNLF